MKKMVALLLTMFFILPVISAQLFDSYNFSPADFLEAIDAQTIFILITFGILSIVLKLILDRVPIFRGKMAGVISVLFSLGATWGINKWFDLNDFLSDIGFSGDIFFYLVIAFFVLLIFLCWKYKWRACLILGGVLILMALFTNLVYNAEIILILGVILFVAGLIWWMKSGRAPNVKTPHKKISWCSIVIVLGLAAGAYGFLMDNLLFLIGGGIMFLLGIFCWISNRKKGSTTLPPGSQPNNPNAQNQNVVRQRNEFEKMNLARKIGVRNLYNEYSKLESEYNKGVENAKELHKKATQLGWNKTKEGNEYYKAWYRKYQRLDELRRRMVDIKNRIDYLKKQIR